ncbi:MAG: serine/threonine-protein kinase [Planctomycetota bacterium]
MASLTDQNLLFGIMALQVNAINSEQLVSAMNQWAPERSETLGTLLLEQGALSADQKDAIESLVVARLQLFADDATRCFAEFDSGTDVTSLVDRFSADAVTTSLALVGSGTRGNARDFDSSAKSLTGNGRYQVKHLHDEGGLGRVFLARDTQLSRNVALKELKPRGGENGDCHARFMAEAEITGGLEHPGIVPVYSLGQNKDGRPFYAMRFIQGQNLQKRIREFHATDWSKHGGKSAQSIEFRRLLDRFLDVCRAIHYSHKRGILHRDIKPANIMLGNYGETLVVDWGLAKWLGQREFKTDEDSPEETLMPSSGSVASATRLGVAAGTPAFMSPEQARGEHDQLGPATDIYGLGATLYMLLTNKRPFEGEDDTLAAVRRGNLCPPRQIVAHIPKPLEAICLKAMAFDTEDRYESAEALAQDVEQYLGDEQIEAYRESSLSRARRWFRKNSAWATAISLVGLMAILSCGGLAVAYGQVDSAKRLAEGERRRAEEERDRARAAERIVDYENRSKEQVTNILLDAVVAIDKDGPTARHYFSEVERQSETLDPKTQIPLLRALGRSHRRRGNTKGAVRVLESAKGLADKAFGEGELETKTIDSELGLAQIESGGDPRALEQLASVWGSLLQSHGETHRETLRAMSNLAAAYRVKGDLSKAMELFERVYRLRQDAFGPSDLDTLRSANNLAVVYTDQKDYGKAREFFADRDLERRLRGSFGEEGVVVATFLNNKAHFQYHNDQLKDALSLYRGVYKQRKELLGAKHYRTLESLHSLGRTLESLGKLIEAEQAYRQSFKLFDPSKSIARERELRSLNGVQLQLREFKKALAAQKQWKALIQNMGSNVDSKFSARATVAEVEALFELGRVDEASERFVATSVDIEKLIGFERLRGQALLGAIQSALSQEGGEERMTTSVKAMRARLPNVEPHQRWYVLRAAERAINHFEDAGKSDEVEKWQIVLEEIKAEINQLRE